MYYSFKCKIIRASYIYIYIYDMFRQKTAIVR
jgi:hypothetical protein